MEGTLLTDDISIVGCYSYKDKLSVILRLNDLFSNPDLVIQENFQRNKISCSMAMGEGILTFGFIKSQLQEVVPMTLLKGNLLDMNLAKSPTLILRKERIEEVETKYDTIIQSRGSIPTSFYMLIKDQVDDTLIYEIPLDDEKSKGLKRETNKK